MIEAAVDELTPLVGTAMACRALGVHRSTVYRWRRPRPLASTARRRRPPRSLSDTERDGVLEVLGSPGFVDAAPAQVYATLLDEGTYMASERTMYRILAANGEVRERRDQLRRTAYAAPELLATRPNQVWSWDIERHEAP